MYLESGCELCALKAEYEGDVKSVSRASGSVAISEPGEEVGGLCLLLLLRVRS